MSSPSMVQIKMCENSGSLPEFLPLRLISRDFRKKNKKPFANTAGGARTILIIQKICSLHVLSHHYSKIYLPTDFPNIQLTYQSKIKIFRRKLSLTQLNYVLLPSCRYIQPGSHKTVPLLHFKASNNSWARNETD